MEGERGLAPIYDHHLQISFSAPPHHQEQEMGFVQFEDHNPVLSFLVAPPQMAAKATTATNNNCSLGFNHAELAVNRPSWNNDQVVDPKVVNDENCSGNANDGGNSWWRSCSSDKNKVKIRRKLREPRFCFQTRSDVDVLDDGYKWRKYGQKVVKNSLHPSSPRSSTPPSLLHLPSLVAAPPRAARRRHPPAAKASLAASLPLTVSFCS